VDASPAALDLSGQGLRDVTRIAASDPPLWTSILAANAGAVRDVLQALRGDLDTVINALGAAEAGGPESAGAHGALGAIARTLAAGNRGVGRIPGKHGGAQSHYEVVTVLVPDAPGELARLFGDVGAAGINIEDLQLEHSPRQPVGLAMISVLAGGSELLERALAARGWRVASEG
jgi:prephenate dehydrogenase